MEKRKISLVTILVIICLSLNVVSVYADSVSTVDLNSWIASGGHSSRLCWYSVHAERHIVFYGDNTHIVYNTSVDGLTWDYGGNIIQIINTLYIDTHYDEDENYFDFVASSQSEDGVPIYYRRGRLESDGSITWLKPWQYLVEEEGVDYKYPRVCTDISDYPYITYHRDIGVTSYPYVLKSDNNDGTFSGFEVPFCLKVLDSSSWATCPVRMDNGTDNEMYILYGSSTNDILYGRYYDGVAYDVEELIFNGVVTGSCYSATNRGDDILLSYYKKTTKDLFFNWRDYSDEIGTKWQTPAPIKVIGENNINMVISLWQNETIVIIWSEPLDDWIFYSYSHDDGVSFSAPISWVDETVDNLKGIYITGYYHQYGTFIGVSYTTLDGTPNKLRYALFTDLPYVPPEEEPEEPLPELLNITINGFVNGEYLFEGEVYEIDSYWNNTNHCYFQLNDTEHVWEYFYYNESQYMGIDVTDFEGLITNELVIGCPYVYIDNNFTGVEENLTRLKWKFILNTQVVDCFNRTLSYYGENQWGNVTSGDTAYDEINIYNLGGYVTYDLVGDAGRITKGDAWELWAENGTVGNPSYAYAETIFRKLQHVHFLVEIDLDLEWNAGNNEFDFDGGGYVEYGIDYRLNQLWVTGWKVRIYPQLATSIDVGNHGAGDDQNWIYWSIEWYYNDTIVDQDFIYSNCYGYDHVDSKHGYTNRTSAQLWVDLWFNKMNSSTVVGGRVNSYYYGAYEQGNPWWFGYGPFRPMTGDMDVSMYFDDLKDIDGTVFTCQKLEIIRAWAKVTKWDYTPDSQDTRWEIMNYEILNFLTAQDRMMGVDTPIFVQTKILEVTTQHGFIQSLYIAITGLGATIWKGALGFSKIFIGAIDSLLMFLGLPEGTFTSLTQMIMMQFTQFLTWMTYLVAQVSNMLSVFSGMISFVLQVITNAVNAILWIFENAIAFPIQVMQLVVAILNGETITLWGRLWDFTSAYGFIEAGKEMLPYSIGVMFMFWLLYGNVQGEGDEDLHGFPRRVLNMFGWMKEIYQNVFFVFNRIRNEIISMYNFIRSHIPSMGGGGGETEE